MSRPPSASARPPSWRCSRRSRRPPPSSPATDPALARSFLTNYSVSTGEAVFRHWRGLAESILTRHVDGYLQQPNGRSQSPGYPAEWLQRVVRERPDQFKLPVDKKPGETDH